MYTAATVFFVLFVVCTVLMFPRFVKEELSSLEFGFWAVCGVLSIVFSLMLKAAG